MSILVKNVLGFGNADDERRVALSLVCISSAAFAFQVLMIIVRVLYIIMIVENLLVLYALLVSDHKAYIATYRYSMYTYVVYTML